MKTFLLGVLLLLSFINCSNDNTTADISTTDISNVTTKNCVAIWTNPNYYDASLWVSIDNKYFRNLVNENQISFYLKPNSSCSMYVSSNLSLPYRGVIKLYVEGKLIETGERIEYINNK
jgi:hypothetical protein